MMEITPKVIDMNGITVKETDESPYWAALLQAQKNISSVGKDGFNAFAKYNYATAEAMIRECRTALAEAGVYVGLEASSMREFKDGEYCLANTYMVHAGGVTKHFDRETPIVPDKGRPFDKAVATADTYSWSYFLRGLLLIPRVEEGTDVDQRDDSKWQPRKAIPHRGTESAQGADDNDYETQINGARSSEDLSRIGNAIKKSAALTTEDKMRLSSVYKKKQSSFEAAE